MVDPAGLNHSHSWTDLTREASGVIHRNLKKIQALSLFQSIWENSQLTDETTIDRNVVSAIINGSKTSP